MELNDGSIWKVLWKSVPQNMMQMVLCIVTMIINTLKQTNKFLSLCETIDDVIDTIYQNATSFQCSIYEKEKDYELKIPVPVKSLKAITFILKENEKQQNELPQPF